MTTRDGMSDEALREIWGRDAAAKLVGTYTSPLPIDEAMIRQLLKDRSALIDDAYEQRAIISRLQSLPSGLAGDVRDAALEEAADLADRAPGQNWSDDTTPSEMARFIADAIRALKTKSPAQAGKGE